MDSIDNPPGDLNPEADGNHLEDVVEEETEALQDPLVVRHLLEVPADLTIEAKVLQQDMETNVANLDLDLKDEETLQDQLER